MKFPAYVKNQKLRTWVQDMVVLCKPETVHWCDGSQQEDDEMCSVLVKSGTFI